MYYKKITVIILILILAAAALSGCSSSSGGNQDNDSEVAEVLVLKSADPELDNKLAIPETGEIEQQFEAQIYNSDDQLVSDQEVKWLEIEAEGVSIQNGLLTVTSAASPGQITITAVSAADPNISRQIELELFRAVSSLTGKITVDFENNVLQSAASGSSGGSSRTSFAEPAGMNQADSERKIINFRSGLSRQAKEKLLKAHSAELIKFINNGDSAVIKLRESASNAAAGLEQANEVNYIEPDQMAWITAASTPDDAEYSRQWNLPLIDFPYVWQDRSSSNKVVAVLDTGIAASHPDLKGNVLPGYNFIGDNSNAEDDHGHGTHVAGIIGAKGDNGIGITGAVWDIKLLPVKVMGSSGGGSISNITEGIRYAAGLTENPENPNPADVINLSLGTRDYSEELENAVLEAIGEGVVVVASAGNYGESSLLYPARIEETIAVGAFNSELQPAAYSHTGDNLDLLAPGGIDVKINKDKEMIYSTVSDGGYGYMAGTSMAAPHISALAALLLDEGAPAAEIENILRQSSVHPGEDDFSREYGYGLVNANFAYNNLQQVKIIVGNREGDQIKKVAESSVQLDGGEYSLKNFPEGSYSVFAWIDVDNDGQIDAEDYLKESAVINFQSQKDYQQDLELLIN